jgi:hypothetical protein
MPLGVQRSWRWRFGCRPTYAYLVYRYGYQGSAEWILLTSRSQSLRSADQDSGEVIEMRSHEWYFQRNHAGVFALWSSVNSCKETRISAHQEMGQ